MVLPVVFQPFLLRSLSLTISSVEKSDCSSFLNASAGASSRAANSLSRVAISLEKLLSLVSILNKPSNGPLTLALASELGQTRQRQPQRLVFFGVAKTDHALIETVGIKSR